MCAVSMPTPGPIVEDTVTDLRYLPLAADGFALTTLSTSAWALSMRFCAGNEILPDRRVHDAGLVDAELHLAGLDLLDRLRDVRRDGAGLRVRHQAARAEHLAEAAHARASCRASRRPRRSPSSRRGSSRRSRRRRRDRRRRPCASFCLSAPAIASTFLLLPRPCGSTTVPRTIWSACFGIDAQPHRHLHRLVELGELHLLNQGNRLLDRVRPVLRPARRPP